MTTSMKANSSADCAAWTTPRGMSRTNQSVWNAPVNFFPCDSAGRFGAAAAESLAAAIEDSEETEGRVSIGGRGMDGATFFRARSFLVLCEQDRIINNRIRNGTILSKDYQGRELTVYTSMNP